MAATTPSPVTEFIQKIEANILTPIVTLISVLAFMLFVYGVVEFIRNGDNEEKRATGQRHMVWGIVGFVIIFGANAIISLIGSLVGST
jgi:hypothetical protein